MIETKKAVAGAIRVGQVYRPVIKQVLRDPRVLQRAFKTEAEAITCAREYIEAQREAWVRVERKWYGQKEAA